jgi:hypothetical protein
MKDCDHAIDPKLGKRSGFALIAALAVMSFMVMIAISLFTLSSVNVAVSTQSLAQTKAQANAKMALMIAIGELQKNVGPDMRISAPSAILDTDEDTEAIDGVVQSQWLGVYDSWGNWLNDQYTPPDKSTLNIEDTYTKGREQIFRRWLLSLPEELKSDPIVDAVAALAASGLNVNNDDEWVTMVGEGSLGDSVTTDPDRVTRAYLTDADETGRYAWWVGGENQKAKVTLAKKNRGLQASTAWEVSAGNTAEVGVGSLTGLTALDDDEASAQKNHHFRLH